jgi:prevent-host-death family protein
MKQPVTSSEPKTIGAFQAKTELSRLLRHAEAGDRFIITQRGRPVAQLIPYTPPETLSLGWGDMEGAVRMSEDFDAPLEMFSEYTKSP